jgi:hypothetical protein
MPMTPFPVTVTDQELIAFIDRWVSLLEQGDYEAAFQFTDHTPILGWTPTLIHEIVSWCGPFNPQRRFTLECAPTTQTERKVVNRWPERTPDGVFGDICYRLNVDGKASDLVATFLLRDTGAGIAVLFQDIA